MKSLHHIVIVGGGAGGLELVTKLGNKLGKKHKARITLVDAVQTHVWKPLLHEVAAGSLNSDASQVDFRAHAQLHYFEFQLGRLCGLNRTDKYIQLAAVVDTDGHELVAERRLDYDTLVIAVGSTANDFGTAGAAEHCLFLDSLKQARSFHTLLLNAFLKKEFLDDPASRKLSIAIVGAGATGVELSAELRYASRQMKHYGMHNITPDKVELKIIEAAPRILPALPERLSKAASRELTRQHIEVLTGSAVSKVSPEGFVLNDGKKIHADIKVWAAGVKAPEFLSNLDGLETNRINQLKIKPTLQTTLDNSIFSFGDCAECFQEGSDRPIPPRAQAAHQQASLLLKTLLGELEGKEPEAFVYHDYGSLVSFSKYTTVGNMMGSLQGKSMFIEGKIARVFYASLYRMHQVAIHGFLRTALIWLNDKITKALNPKMKLH